MREGSPTTLTILGATGDLSQKKLFPALLDLYDAGALPKNFRVVGFSRKDFTSRDFRSFIGNSVSLKNRAQKSAEKFLKRVDYIKGDFLDPSAYEKVALRLIKTDSGLKAPSNKLFYLSTSPKFYEPILKNLADSGLSVQHKNESWVRVLIEKPFGRDLKTARGLDRLLGLLFKEEQIFRIDHYLAKEVPQNILAFRFSNEIFEPVWNRTYIEKIEINLFEKAGIGERGNFYDGVGELRDMGQSHILQMLALVAMERPQEFGIDAVRKKRAEVLESLVPISKKNIKKLVKKGQYKEYLSEKDVKRNSKTETYFKVEARIKNKRWNGVPFTLEAGKRMTERKAEIKVYFKKAPCLCSPENEFHHQNILTFRIQPEEGIKVLFWAKKPGFGMELDPKELSFSYAEESGNIPDAYQKVLLDALYGDQTLFTSTREIDAAWKFIVSILKNWSIVKLDIY